MLETSEIMADVAILHITNCDTNFQPRSQGLSSSHPLEQEKGEEGGGGKKRDPGNEVY